MHRKAPVSLLSLCTLFSPVLASSGDAAVCNANHIFNAIHSSMRQWGGSLNHNGMSLFLATVPEGTQLYHGTSDPEFIKGMQWLAFEPEHALIFAHPRGGRGPGGPPPSEGGQPSEDSADEKLSDAEETPHSEENWRHRGQSLEYGHGPEQGAEHEPPLPPHRDDHHDRPDFRLPHDDTDCEHRQPPPDHKHGLPPPPHGRKPCNGTDCRLPPHWEHAPPPPDHERGPRRYRDHGPPPPLPPGHVYKPYPPPPRKKRPYKGPRRAWNPNWHGPQPHRADSSEHHEHEEQSGSIALRSELKHRLWKRQIQQPLIPSPSPSSGERVGYLHTYAPTHDLHLLYIDGLSAGKTSNGTLDTQDRLLLNLTSSSPDGPAGGPMGGEMARARGLCDLASTLWQGRVDGVIRLEGGFEIILCEFEKHLERVDVVSISPGEGRRGVMGGWEYTRAVASRYHGIGGGRVRVDYDRFVSVFAYADVKGVWENDVKSDVSMPRLTNVSSSDLQRIRGDVTALILAKDWNEEGRDWQAVSDMVVQRYSKPLHHIIHTRAFREDKEELARYLRGLLKPFIDAGARNATLELARCVKQIVPAKPSLRVPPGSLQPLAHHALHTVGTRICDTLLTSLSIATSATPHSSFKTVYAEHAVEAVAELVEWLSWTSWKECGTCGDEEVCFIPIWPTGTLEDHAKPRCRGPKEVEGRMGYWGLRRGRPSEGKAPGGKSSDDKKKEGGNGRIIIEA